MSRSQARLKKAFREGQRNVIGFLVEHPAISSELPVTHVDKILEAFWEGAAPILQAEGGSNIITDGKR